MSRHLQPPAVQRRRRGARVLLAAAVLLTGLAVVLPSGQGPAGAAASVGVTRSVTATRTFLDADGTAKEVSSNHVTVHVSQTTELRGRQEIQVSWEGAVPTGAVVADPNASEGRNQEYPFVLLQCRGVDATKVPKGQARLTPETCWTQTAAERYLAAATHTPSWRFDAYASPAERAAVVGAPDSPPAACDKLTVPLSARWLPFRAADGKVYYGGPDPGAGCTPLPPEADSAEAGGLPSNTTYGVTGKDGRGTADFAVWTKAENASLGCSAAVSCALVAVPIVGLSCDAWGTKLPTGTVQTTRSGTPLSEDQKTSADISCRKKGSYAGGEPVTGRSTDQAVRGNLWWSASNWRNRITVPLSFAPTAEVCAAVSKEKPVELMGSAVLNELTASWRPRFCTTKGLFTFTHVQQADELARSLVESGEIVGAFSSAPKEGGYRRPVVQAPLAFGGFAIAFTIDDADGQRREDLKLNARLVAKLLTASYPATSFVRAGHPGLGENPYNLTVDPEFQKLNPGIPESATLESAAAMQILSSSSDLVWALTRWLDTDPSARAWLDGTPDQWGMKVNPAYKGLDLPVDNWPLLDDFVAPQWYIDQNPCYRNSPTPYLQLVANPASGLNAISLNMQYALSTVQTSCRYDGYDATTLPLRAQGRQAVGHRFVLGLVSLSAARRYHLRTAALETTPGRFVKADEAGLAKAAGLLAPDTTGTTWVVDSTKLATAAGERAYPGALPVYAVVPTSGLDAPVAGKLAHLLCYAAGDGQRPGTSNGALPAGYLPLTEANGFRKQRGYLAAAIAAVRAQKGATPTVETNGPKIGEACDFSRAKPPAVPSAAPSAAPALVPPAAAPAVAVVPPAPQAAAPAAGSPAAGQPVVEAATTLTAGERSTLGRLGVPGLLALAAVAALAGTILRWLEVLVAAAGELRSLRRGRPLRGKRVAS